jgi:hypothetical protein
VKEMALKAHASLSGEGHKGKAGDDQASGACFNRPKILRPLPNTFHPKVSFIFRGGGNRHDMIPARLTPPMLMN